MRENRVNDTGVKGRRGEGKGGRGKENGQEKGEKEEECEGENTCTIQKENERK